MRVRPATGGELAPLDEERKDEQEGGSTSRSTRASKDEQQRGSISRSFGGTGIKSDLDPERISDDEEPAASRNSKRKTEFGEEALGKDVQCIISTHIDDVEGSGGKAMQDSLLAALRRDYGGDVKIEVGEFVHTGIMHKQDPKTFEVYTNQDHYVKEISEISLTGIDTSNLAAPLSDAMKTLFWSLLGALPWLQQTRADIAPFIGYLQREAHQPTVLLLKLANKILRYVRRVKSGIVYKKLIPPSRW